MWLDARMTYDEYKTATPPEYETMDATACDECGTVFERKTDLGKALELLAKAEVFFKSSTDITINTYGADIAKFMDRMREKGHI